MAAAVPTSSLWAFRTTPISVTKCEQVAVTTPVALVVRRSFLEDLHRVWRMFYRLLRLSITLAPIWCFFPLFWLVKPDTVDVDTHELVLDEDESKRNPLLAWYYRLCLGCVERSGAAVIKLMQWAGSRPDLFGHDFCAVFGKLQDDTTPHSLAHTEKQLRKAFGTDWKDRIEVGEILGSGCIGQVYRGKTPDGDVAVKVLHPNVDGDIEADLDLMRASVRVAEHLPFLDGLRWLDLPGVVEEFATLLRSQLDLRNEAKNLERFNVNFRDSTSIVFPKLIEGFAPTRDVLVETFCDGEPILKFAKANRDNQEALSKLCFDGIEAVCQMIFLDNFMHGDLHPGNVYISSDCSKLILFDVGIVAEYTDADHGAIVDILSSFIRKEGRQAGLFMINDSNRRLKDAGEFALDEELFLKKIEKLTIMASTKGYLMENLGTYISYICGAASKHHVMINPAFVSASLAVKVQEGIALALDPSMQIWKVAIPIIVESERRRMGSVRATAKVLGVESWIGSWLGDQSENNGSSSK